MVTNHQQKRISTRLATTHSSIQTRVSCRHTPTNQPTNQQIYILTPNQAETRKQKNAPENPNPNEGSSSVVMNETTSCLKRQGSFMRYNSHPNGKKPFDR